MSKLADALAELADEEGMSDADVAKLADEIKRRREKRANPGDALAVRGDDEGLAKAPTGNERGIAMYGNETAREALERWREQEEDDPDGVYGLGGATAGGIFGTGQIAMTDYDPAARTAGERRAGAQLQQKTMKLVELLTERLEQSQGRVAQLEAAPKERGGALRRLLKGRGQR